MNDKDVTTDNSMDGLTSEQTDVKRSVGAGTYLNIPLKKIWRQALLYDPFEIA